MDVRRQDKGVLFVLEGMRHLSGYQIGLIVVLIFSHIHKRFLIFSGGIFLAGALLLYAANLMVVVPMLLVVWINAIALRYLLDLR